MKNILQHIGIGCALFLTSFLASAQESASCNDTILGQLQTAEKLRTLMLAGDCDEAVNLFSQKQQVNIEKMKAKPDYFAHWCQVWKLDDETYRLYTDRIKAGRGIFVLEDEIWKIDEK